MTSSSSLFSKISIDSSPFSPVAFSIIFPSGYFIDTISFFAIFPSSNFVIILILYDNSL